VPKFTAEPGSADWSAPRLGRRTIAAPIRGLAVEASCSETDDNMIQLPAFIAVTSTGVAKHSTRRAAVTGQDAQGLERLHAVTAGPVRQVVGVTAVSGPPTIAIESPSRLQFPLGDSSFYAGRGLGRRR
jgi:hypothetical protein